ncbi:ciliary microtubule inner protein 2B-like [Amphiura filiformis]|uniref:ciliary microtubule inner protein 2B-like n=1 Tax=Amphiura filiformis TaxID=82378 RepID=UPI003B2193E2
MMNLDMTNSTSWNIERRRDFAQLKPGTQVPGYCGYIEQYKYHVGDTYGNGTKTLSKTYKNRHPITSTYPHHHFENKTTYVGTGLSGTHDVQEGKRSMKLPKSTGDNKLTEKMVPGYTGYIPRMPFKFGNTYKEDCDVCIDDFKSNTQRRDNEIKDIKQTLIGSTRLRPIATDKHTTIRLNEYRDRNPTGKVLHDEKRDSREAPIPGYKGFIPRQGVSELGLGSRYHTMCDKSLNVFYDETQTHRSKISNPLSRTRPTASDDETKASIQLTREDREAMMHRRLYKQIGMVPKYTGYLPQIRFQFGHTYGDTTRSLPVCFHDKPNFGTHVNKTLTPLQQSV